MFDIKTLSEENIKITEDFIVNNACKPDYPNLCFSDLYNAQEAYNEIIKLDPTSYVYFGSNAFGMTSYGFYKTLKNDIYIIQAYCNVIECYYDPKNVLEKIEKPLS